MAPGPSKEMEKREKARAFEMDIKVQQAATCRREEGSFLRFPLLAGAVGLAWVKWENAKA